MALPLDVRRQTTHSRSNFCLPSYLSEAVGPPVFPPNHGFAMALPLRCRGQIQPFTIPLLCVFYPISPGSLLVHLTTYCFFP